MDCVSPISRTSISACRHAAGARCRTPSTGCASASPTWSASPAISSRAARGCPSWNACSESSAALRRSRQPRLRGQPRSVLAAHRPGGDREAPGRGAARRRGDRRGAAGTSGPGRRRRSAVVRRLGQPCPTGLRRRAPTCASSSATSRGSLAVYPASSTSSSRVTCIGSDRRAVPRWQASARAPTRARRRGRLRLTAGRSSTSRRVSARPSFPSGSSPGRR